MKKYKLYIDDCRQGLINIMIYSIIFCVGAGLDANNLQGGLIGASICTTIICGIIASSCHKINLKHQLQKKKV